MFYYCTIPPAPVCMSLSAHAWEKLPEPAPLRRSKECQELLVVAAQARRPGALRQWLVSCWLVAGGCRQAWGWGCDTTPSVPSIPSTVGEKMRVCV